MRLLFYLLILQNLALFGQDTHVKKQVVDSLYREDQFYINITYNSLRNAPSGLSQNGLSPGISFGFLRDFPINKSRTIAFAPGFGFSILGINHNLRAQQVSSEIVYDLINESEFDNNRLSIYMVEIPVELRWRTSTPESHKFWRIYAGFKMSYVFYNRWQLKSDLGNIDIRNNKNLEDFQLSSYLTFGFNTWNFYLQYGISPIMKDQAILNNEKIKMGMLNLGIQFYIL